MKFDEQLWQIPDFPLVGITIMFAENYMKMKNNWTEMGHASLDILIRH